MAVLGERQILHVDMDAFYASVEQREDPSLRGKPVVVGGPSRRGVVSAASYEARKFGVRSAMPMGEALRRCPEACVVPPRMHLYAEASARVFEIFRRFTPLVEGLSLDEAFLDVTGSRALFGDGEAIARRIKQMIREETKLTASAGVAPCKFVAKIASDLEKPDGLVVIAVADLEARLAPLAIERMWGIGPRASLVMREAGFDTIGDLARSTEERLERLLGSWGRTVHRLARGIDERDVFPGERAKSVGAEETFEHDLRARGDIATRLLSQSRRVARRLVRAGLCGKSVSVKLKYSDFTVRSRQLKLPEPVDDTDSIHAAALALLDRFPEDPRGIRLTGVAVGALERGPPPRVLFPDARRERRSKLEHAVAALEERFGSRGVTRAALLRDEGERGD